MYIVFQSVYPTHELPTSRETELCIRFRNYLGFFFFFDFWGFQVSETPIKHTQNLKLMAEVNSMLGDSPISVNILVPDLHKNM